MTQTLHRQREVRPPFARRNRVQLVEDQRARRPERVPSPLRRQQDVQRLRRRDEHVRRPARVERPLLLRRVPRPHRDPYLRQRLPHLLRQRPYLLQRREQVPLDVVRQRLQRRHVHNLRLVRQPRLVLPTPFPVIPAPFSVIPAKAGISPPYPCLPQRLLHQHVEARQERRERLAGARRRSDERMPPGRYRRPTERLRVRRRAEPPLEPRPHDGMERIETHAPHATSPTTPVYGQMSHTVSM